MTIAPLPAAGGVGAGALAHAVAYFPVVGLALGAATAALDHLLLMVFPAPVATVLDLACLAVASGGLHLDGLADAADGLFVTGDRRRRLSAMRDSRVGAFGASALALVIVLEFASLSSVGPGERAAALVLSVALSRWAMSLAVWSFPSARSDGLGDAVKRSATARDMAVASAMAGLAAGALVSVMAATLAIGVAVVATLGIAGLALARLGGLTGDLYGAIGEVVFAASLVVFSARGI